MSGDSENEGAPAGLDGSHRGRDENQRREWYLADAGFQQIVAVAEGSGDRDGMKLVATYPYGHQSVPEPWHREGHVVVLRFEHETERR